MHIFGFATFLSVWGLLWVATLTFGGIKFTQDCSLSFNDLPFWSALICNWAGCTSKPSNLVPVTFLSVSNHKKVIFNPYNIQKNEQNHGSIMVNPPIFH